MTEDERPDEDGVDNEHNHQELDVSPKHIRGDPREWNSSLQGNEPALLDGHTQHTHLPHHVWNVVKNEIVQSFRRSIFSVRRVHEDHVEIHQGKELEGRENLGHRLEAIEFGIELDLDTAVVADHKNHDRKSVEHNNQCRNSLGWVEIQEGASVVEMEHLVNVSLGSVEVTWCPVEKLVGERTWVVVDREVDHVGTEEKTRPK